MILAIDPGSLKCGLAWFDDENKLVQKEVVSRQTIRQKIEALKPNLIIIGDTANGRQLKKELNSQNIVMVEERNSSLEARQLYWKEHPPKGFWKLIPLSLRVPPVAIDDYAAAILAQRHFNR